MVAVSPRLLSHRNALMVAGGPAVIDKIVRPLKDEGIEVAVCEDLDEAREVFNNHALIILPIDDKERDETDEFITWVRDQVPKMPYILAVGSCGEKQRGALVASRQLNDLISLPYTEQDVRDRLSSYHRWFRLNDANSVSPVEGPQTMDPREAPFFTTSTTAMKDEVPEEIYCREAPIGIAMFDRELRYILANPRWKQQFNLGDDVIGKTQFEVFPSLHPDWGKIYQCCLQGETRRGREVLPSPGNRDAVEMRWEVRPWRYTAGAIGGITIAFEDVWKSREERAREASMPHEIVPPDPTPLDLPTPWVRLDLDGLIRETNHAADSFASVKPSDDRLVSFSEAFPGESDREFLNKLKEIRSTRNGDLPLSSFETLLHPETGESLCVAWCNRPDRAEDGSTVGAIRVGVVFPEELLSARRGGEYLSGSADDENDLTPIRTLDEVALNQMSELIWKAKPDGQIQFFNEAWLTFRGREKDDECGGGWIDGLDEGEAKGVKAFVASVIHEKGQGSYEFRLRDAEGDFCPVRMWVWPVIEGDDVQGFVGACRILADESFEADTVREELEAQKIVALRQAEIAEGERDLLKGELKEVRAELEKLEAAAAKLQEALDETKDREKDARDSPEAIGFREAPLMLWRCNAKGEVTAVSREWERFRGGLAKQESIFAWLGNVPQSDRDRVRETFRKAAEEGQPLALSLILKDATGLDRRVECRATPIVNEARENQGLTGVMRDVTDEMRRSEKILNRLVPGMEGRVGQTVDEVLTEVETQVNQSRADFLVVQDQLESFQEMFDQVAFGIILLDPEGAPVFANKRHQEILGFDLNEVGDMEAWLRRGCPDPKHARDVISAWQTDVWQRQLTRVFTLTNADGILREIEFQPQLFVDDNRLLLTVMDVTDSKRAEEALRDRDIRFRALFRDSAIGIVLIDSENKIYDINPALEKTLGISRRQMLSQSFDECVHPEDTERKEALIDQMTESARRVGQLELRLVRQKDGGEEPVWVRLNISIVRDLNQKVLFTAYFVQDITDHQIAQTELKTCQEQNRALLEVIPGLVVLVEGGGQVIDFLPSEEVLLGVSEGQTIGRPIDDIFPALQGRLDSLVEEARQKNDVVIFSFEHAESGAIQPLQARLVACKPDYALITIEAADVKTSPHADEGIRGLGFAKASQPMMLTDDKGEIQELNAAAEKLFDVPRSEALELALPGLFGMETMEAFGNRLTYDAERVRWKGKLPFEKANGNERLVSVTLQSLSSDASDLDRNGYFCEFNQEDASETSLERVREENLDRMIPRMHQRLRYNLEIISTLLNLQFKAQPGKEARDVLLAGKNRVRSLLILHEMIKTRQDEQAIDLRGLTQRLASELLESYQAADRIRFHIEIEDVLLDLHVASPLALILNELLTNVIQHAFPGGMKGSATVRFAEDEGEAMLTVVDTGQGFQSTKLPKNRVPGLGIQIIRTLVGQIGGRVEKGEGLPTEVRVIFPRRKKA